MVLTVTQLNDLAELVKEKARAVNRLSTRDSVELHWCGDSEPTAVDKMQRLHEVLYSLVPLYLDHTKYVNPTPDLYENPIYWNLTSILRYGNWPVFYYPEHNSCNVSNWYRQAKQVASLLKMLPTTQDILGTVKITYVNTYGDYVNLIEKLRGNKSITWPDSYRIYREQYSDNNELVILKNIYEKHGWGGWGDRWIPWPPDDPEFDASNHLDSNIQAPVSNYAPYGTTISAVVDDTYLFHYFHHNGGAYGWLKERKRSIMVPVVCICGIPAKPMQLTVKMEVLAVEPTQPNIDDPGQPPDHLNEYYFKYAKQTSDYSVGDIITAGTATLAAGWNCVKLSGFLPQYSNYAANLAYGKDFTFKTSGWQQQPATGYTETIGGIPGITLRPFVTIKLLEN